MSAKSDPKREAAKKARRDRYARNKAAEIAAQAEALEQQMASEPAPAKTDLDAIAPKKPGTAGGSKSPTLVAKARDNLTDAFDLMGGVPALVRWGRMNQTEFYRIWARLIPKEAADATSQMPLEQLLAQLATKSEKSVAEAAYEIGEETLAAAAKQVSIEDAQAAFVRSEKDTIQ